MAKNYKELLRDVEAICLDYDGVFTDGIIHLLSNGELARTANIRDGYVVQYAKKKGIKMAIITGGTQEAVRTRFEGLGIQDVFLGSKDKVKVLDEYCLQHEIDPQKVLYMGDDIPDIPVMRKCGLPTCPADAAPEVKEAVIYISPFKGGHGCVRDVLEQVLKSKGLWMVDGSFEW